MIQGKIHPSQSANNNMSAKKALFDPKSPTGKSAKGEGEQTAVKHWNNIVWGKNRRITCSLNWTQPNIWVFGSGAGIKIWKSLEDLMWERTKLKREKKSKEVSLQLGSKVRAGNEIFLGGGSYLLLWTNTIGAWHIIPSKVSSWTVALLMIAHGITELRLTFQASQFESKRGSTHARANPCFKKMGSKGTKEVDSQMVGYAASRKRHKEESWPGMAN